MNKIIVYFFILSFLSACINDTQKDADLIASSISVSYKFSQEISAGNRADIILTNETTHCIVFPLIEGLRIYTEQNNNQIEVQNLIDIIGNQNLILSPMGEPLSSRIVPLRPDTSSFAIELPKSFL